MAIINTERFVNALIKSKPIVPVARRDYWEERTYLVPSAMDRRNLRSRIFYALGGGTGGPCPVDPALLSATYDRDSALAVYGQIKDYIKDRGTLLCKELRPWELDPEVYSSLDQSVPWLGFEFETGWSSNKTRAEAIEHCWNTWDNVVFDSEGEGAAPVEITFAPQELSKYLDGTADAYQFMEYVNSSKNTVNHGGMMVGTHVNISLPFMRDETLKDTRRFYAMEKLTDMMNRTLGSLGSRGDGGNEYRYRYFGRQSLYGGCYESGSCRWLEFKVFRTAYTLEQFKTYLDTSQVLVRCLEKLYDNSDNFTKEGWDKFFVSNLREMLDDPNVEPVLATEARFTVNHNGNGWVHEDDYEDDAELALFLDEENE